MSAFSGGRPRWLVPVAIVVGVILLLLVVPLVAAYNGLVEKESSVDQSFADSTPSSSAATT